MAKKVEKISLEKLLELSLSDFNSAIESLSYEDGLALLEELLQNVERGSFTLEKSVLSYERGMALLKFLRNKLQAAEERMKLLREEDGELLIEE